MYSKVFSDDEPYQRGVGVWCFRDYLCLHHQGSIWWVLCLHAMFIHEAVLCPSQDCVGNDGQSQIVMPCPYAACIRNTQLFHLNSCCLLLVFSILTNNQLFDLGSRLGQDIIDHPTPPAVTHTVWAGPDNSCVHKYSVQTTPITLTPDDGDRLSLSHRAPTPHWHGWLLKIVPLYTIAVKDSNNVYILISYSTCKPKLEEPRSVH
jgi:hypothetical protein